MGSECSSCSNCKGNTQIEIQNQQEEMTNGVGSDSINKDGGQIQVKNTQINGKNQNVQASEVPLNEKQDTTANYADPSQDYKNEKNARSPIIISQQLSIGNQGQTEQTPTSTAQQPQGKQLEETHQELSRQDSRENKLNHSGKIAQLNSIYKDQPIEEVVPAQDLTNKEPVREKRPQYQFKSGAIYEGSWIGISFKCDYFYLKLFLIQGNMRDGYGIQTWPDGARYEGEWKDNKAHGKGKFWHVDGDIFEGFWSDDKANGQGTYVHVNGAKYEGEWKDDLQDGFGIETWTDGSRYEGNYKDGKKHGPGTYTWSDCSKYIGDWVENRISGKGLYTWLDGRKYDGEWLNNNMHGKGYYTWKDGRMYDGEYQFDKKHGFGIYTWADGRRYEGKWAYGKQHGKGKYILPDGSIKIGEWEDGKRIKWHDNETDIEINNGNNIQIKNQK